MTENTNILIVEDEAIVAKNIQVRLENLGYNVTDIAVSGEEAVQKATDVPPDLLLMDIKLKGAIDGIEAVKQINDQLDIPVVYLTAYADEDTLLRAKTTAPFGYLIKPFETRELYATIEMALYKHLTEMKLKDREQLLTGILRRINEECHY